jgi:hypothetical protein
MNERSGDVAIGLVLFGARTGLSAARLALLPARAATHAPVIGPTMRRRTDDLAHQGRLARERALVQAEELTATALASPDVERVVARALMAMDVDRIIAAVLDHERTEQVIERALLTPGLERLIVRVLESRLVDDLTERVLASPEMERVVAYVATSPQVLDAVSHQTRSLADEMASNVRRRAESVDEVAERTVRGWLRRPRPQPT